MNNVQGKNGDSPFNERKLFGLGQSPFLLKNIVRALRLPFLTVSILPFIFGSLVNRVNFNFFIFLLGLGCVIFTHLGANLINDYSDSKSGADWQDKKFYGFFGGSKLIQENVLSEKFYFTSAIFCFVVSIGFALILSAALKNLSVVWFYFLILFLSASYSYKPLQLSYHKLGELVIFTLFGPALVMGGYFLQTGIFPDTESFFLSLPFGFLTAAILFANEIPDYAQDKKCGKINWVSFLGPERSYILYTALIVCAFAAIGINIFRHFLSPVSGVSFLLLFPAFKAAGILKKFYPGKLKLIQSSKLTILAHNIVSIILILSSTLSPQGRG